MNLIGQNTADRLANYEVFSDKSIDTAAIAAEKIASFETYQQLFNSVGVHEPEVLDTSAKYPTKYVDIRPADYDSDEALIVHLPMANTLDNNQLYSLASIAMQFPHTRIIATGNPGGEDRSGSLAKLDRKRVAISMFQPTVEPLARFIETEGIIRTKQVGGSYGTEKAVALDSMGITESTHLVTIEPANVVQRSLLKLASAFASTNSALEYYVDANELETFKDARKVRFGLAKYTLGLCLPTNIAVAKGMTDGYFFQRAIDTLAVAQPDSKISIAWGSESELCVDTIAQTEALRMARILGKQRVQALRIPGAKHALANDLALQNAIIAESVSR